MVKTILNICELKIPASEIKMRAVRSKGPGGQHVNKVSTACQLTFDVLNSTLPDHIKVKILQTRDKRLNKNGEFKIVADDRRSLLKNRKVALDRLENFLRRATKPKKKRKKSVVPKKEKEKRLRAKKIKSEKKASRRTLER